ncbi:TIGR02186 family protein [Allosphingosinicella deserti]|uniref:TIGR02186 family protein n=1 Tax=Allosphingosinicella deserti TaxID=2116704 RepID=UPI0026C842EB
MRALRGALLLLLAPLALGAAEPKLVPDVSQSRIDIQYSFTGAELLLFGAIVYPGGKPPREGAEIVVVVKGPVQPLVLREKQKVAGIWMNVESARFRSAPAFYAVASSRPLAEMVDERTAAIYELGLQNLQLSPGTGAAPDVQRRFEAGLIDLMQRHQLYFEDPKGVRISEGVLYRARVNIPARVPVGNYTAETFLIRDGRVLAGAVREIQIEKLGFERFVATAADRWSLTYGLVAVLLSLFLGWSASAFFRKG